MLPMDIDQFAAKLTQHGYGRCLTVDPAYAAPIRANRALDQEISILLRLYAEGFQNLHSRP